MIEFITDEKFLIPLLTTLGASLTIIIGQQIFGFSARQRKKLYCINYVSDIAFRLLSSNLVLIKNTVNPHIVATKKILNGDSKLLDVMFETDEFDILNGKNIEFNHLPEEYKLHIGYDDMSTLQVIEFIISLSRDKSAEINLNEFVKENLKSKLHFYSKPENEKTDILKSYWDYLDEVKRQFDRINGFIINMFIPLIENYESRFIFKFYSTKNIRVNLIQIKELKEQSDDLIPSLDTMRNNIKNGIQKVL